MAARVVENATQSRELVWIRANVESEGSRCSLMCDRKLSLLTSAHAEPVDDCSWPPGGELNPSSNALEDRILRALVLTLRSPGFEDRDCALR